MNPASLLNATPHAIAIAIAIACIAAPAYCQQKIPSSTISRDASSSFGGRGGWSAQGVPGEGGTPTIGNTGTSAITKAWLAEDHCSFKELSAQDLSSVRAAILDMLGQDENAKNSFITSEKNLSGSCAREKVSFYLRAIARIKSAR